VAAREKAVGKAIAKSARSRHRSRGQRHCSTLWDHIANQGETCARQAAAWICVMAAEHGCTVIVFEHLRSYRPKRGTRSARSNRRRSYWLRGRIRRYTAEKAIAAGVLTVERNPAWTSQMCPRCQRLGERFSASRKNPAHRARFACPACGWQGDAEVVAAFNLKRKWGRSFRYPTKAERDQRTQTCYTKAVSRETAARPANPQPGDAGPARCPELAPHPGGRRPQRLVSDGLLVVGLC
jgi:IS605 OrfB family transposase